jgi:hypothetical protein
MSIEFKKGMQIRVKTRTKENTFGTVVYEISEVLPNDVIRCVILHGTGPAARPGYPVTDTGAAILQNIADGITEIVPQADCAKNKAIATKKAEVYVPGRSGLGIEM